MDVKKLRRSYTKEFKLETVRLNEVRFYQYAQDVPCKNTMQVP
jgi:transposase-like protein